MDFWETSIYWSWFDVQSITGTKRWFTLLFAVLVFVVVLMILRHFLTKNSIKEKVIEALISAAVLIFCGALLFVFCLFFVAPSQIYYRQRNIIDTQSKDISKLMDKLQQSPHLTDSELKELNDSRVAFASAKFFRGEKHDWNRAAHNFEKAYVCAYRVSLSQPQYWEWTAHLAGDLADMYEKEHRTNEAERVKETRIAILDAVNPAKPASKLYEELSKQVQ